MIDIDDYWLPHETHPSYALIKMDKLDQKILNNLRLANYVSTTTNYFAEEISKVNKNVIVVPNAIDCEELQYIPIDNNNNINDDKLRVGFLAGSSHLRDLELLSGVISKLKGDKIVPNKLSFMLAGFDIRGTQSDLTDYKMFFNTDNVKEWKFDPAKLRKVYPVQYDIIMNFTKDYPQLNELPFKERCLWFADNYPKTRKIKPQESVWNNYEKIFTDNYSTISSKYKDYLLTYDKNSDIDFDINNEPYRRYCTLPVTKYATNYNNLDISIAPLIDHMFNRCKSNLKVIEAGFLKKALICSEVGPYVDNDLINVYQRGGIINDKGNVLLVDKTQNHSDWYKYIKLLANNPNLVKQMGNNLYDMVSKKYEIKVVSTLRRDYYMDILK